VKPWAGPAGVPFFPYRPPFSSLSPGTVSGEGALPGGNIGVILLFYEKHPCFLRDPQKDTKSEESAAEGMRNVIYTDNPVFFGKDPYQENAGTITSYIASGV
jgi:hypothetical protein